MFSIRYTYTAVDKIEVIVIDLGDAEMAELTVATM
jgi:hypothetical protein